MGISTSKTLYGLWYNNEKEVNASMVGYGSSGKTTILYKLLNDEVVNTLPTIGYNNETIKYKNLKLNVWDIGGNGKNRFTCYGHFCPKSNAIIFVIDSHDIDQIYDAWNDFIISLCHKYINENIPILIYANKQDLPNALSCNEITEKLNLHSIKQEWYIEGTCATTGDGLYEGL